MLKNYFKIAARNLVKKFGYSFINIFGLAVGLACCLLLTLFIMDERSYDKFHKDADNIYRANMMYNYGGRSGKMYHTPTALLPNILREFSEVKTGTRLFDVSIFSPVVVQMADKQFQENKFLYADSTFFDVFSFPLVHGDPDKVLAAPNSVVLTQSTAKNYFGNENPIGKVLKINNSQEFQVTGVALDLPHNSHFHFDFLASFNSLAASKSEVWYSANYATYIVFDNPENKTKIESGVSEMAQRQMGEHFTKEGNTLAFDMMPVTDIHLYSDLPVEFEPQGDIKTIYIFGLIGLLILTIACINYMNLATARSADRAREVGMRKVLGAHRQQLFYQFMGESLIITTISAILAFAFVGVVLTPFNAFTGKIFTIADLFSQPIVVGAAVAVLLVSLLAGAYPALSLSSYEPGSVLKGSFKRSSKGGLLRQLLVVVQFSVSIFLIIGTLVIYKQLNFMRETRLGYEKVNVLILPTDREVNKNFDRIKSQLESRPDVIGVSIASENPANINGGYTVHVEGMESDKTISVNAVTVDKDFISNMGMSLAHGKDFTEADVERSTKAVVEEREYSFIVNEQLLKDVFISPDEAIGLKTSLNGRSGRIVGVVNDFHFSSLKNKINPLVLFIEPAQYNEIFIKIKPDNISETLAGIGNDWKTLVPHRPFDYRFLDQEYDALYKSELRLGNIFTLFAVLAIVIACLGLLGLVAFTVEQRTKEIGIRKVLGATLTGLFILVSKDFTRLVIIAFLIAAPLGYYLMTQWLSEFEYKVNIGIAPVAVAIVVTLFLSLVTISFQSIKAALMNPVDTLRNE